LTASATAVQANGTVIDPQLEQRIRDGFARWNAGDHSFDPEWTAEDVEIHSAVADFAGTVYRGQDGVRQWVEDMREVFDEWQLALDELEEFAPGRVIGIGTVHLRGRGSGVSVDQPCAWLFDHVDGVMTRFEPFLNRVGEARAIAAR
jgi:ketosteroid isomerase-like protein